MKFLESNEFISLLAGAIIALFGFVFGLYAQSIKSQIECDKYRQTRLLTKVVSCKNTQDSHVGHEFGANDE